MTARGQGWRDLPVNLGEIVLRKILVHLLLGISPEETALEPDKYEMLAAAVEAVSGERLAERLRGCRGALPPGIFREMRRWRLTWTAIFPGLRRNWQTGRRTAAFSGLFKGERYGEYV